MLGPKPEFTEKRPVSYKLTLVKDTYTSLRAPKNFLLYLEGGGGNIWMNSLNNYKGTHSFHYLKMGQKSTMYLYLDSINNGWLRFSCVSFRFLVFCMPADWALHDATITIIGLSCACQIFSKCLLRKDSYDWRQSPGQLIWAKCQCVAMSMSVFCQDITSLFHLRKVTEPNRCKAACPYST